MRALVLSGGGVKGAYQVGALQKWIYEDAIDYDAFCGVSVGAINSAFLAQFPGGNPQDAWTKLKAIWDRVTTKNIKKGWWPLGIIESLWKPSVYNSKPLQDWIHQELDQGAITQSGKSLRIVAVSWDTFQPRVVTEADSQIPDWVLASASFPVFLLPITLNGQLWTDGGARSVTPLGEAIRLGATEIDIIMCSNPDSVPAPTDPGLAAIPGFLERAVSIMSNQIEVADFKICGLKNDLVELRPEYRKVQLRLLQPRVPLTDDSLNFDPVAIKRMMAQGYRDACVLENT
jgi:NTE family protein